MTTVPFESHVDGGNTCLHSSQSQVSHPDRPPTANARILSSSSGLHQDQFIQRGSFFFTHGISSSSPLHSSSGPRSDFHDGVYAPQRPIHQLRSACDHVSPVGVAGYWSGDVLWRPDQSPRFWACTDGAMIDHVNVAYPESLSYLWGEYLRNLPRIGMTAVVTGFVAVTFARRGRPLARR